VNCFGGEAIRFSGLPFQTIWDTSTHEDGTTPSPFAKSVMNALAGILVRQGRLALDHAVPLGEWQAADDPRHAITLDQLLRMSE
jgi:hypothetical protein